MHKKTLSIGLLKRLALMRHEKENFFIHLDAQGNKIAYEGAKDDAELELSVLPDVEKNQTNLDKWYSENLVEVQEYDQNSSRFLVCTQEEANKLVANYLDNYYESEVKPELLNKVGNNAKYFSKSAWKRDVLMNGYGPILATYNGHEYEVSVQGNVFLIYQTN